MQFVHEIDITVEACNELLRFSRYQLLKCRGDCVEVGANWVLQVCKDRVRGRDNARLGERARFKGRVRLGLGLIRSNVEGLDENVILKG